MARVSNSWIAGQALNGHTDDSAEYQPCRACRGTGFTDQYEDEVCWSCGGEGEVPVIPGRAAGSP